MLFVPAGVGVIAHLDIFRAEAMPIMAAVIGGTAITLFVTAIVASRFGATPVKDVARAEEQKPSQLEGLARESELRGLSRSARLLVRFSVLAWV
jgi:holin-like protein